MERDVSRRKFLKGSVLLGAGTAGTVLINSLTGCGALNGGDAAEEKKAGDALAAGSHSYTVHEADAIVVGGGMAGLNAVRMLMNEGVSVIMVDKGPAGHSGNSGVLWGQTFVTTEKMDAAKMGIEFLTVDVMGIMNQEQARHVVQAHIDGQPRSAIEQSGNMFQREGSDGKVAGIDGPIAATHNTLYKQLAQAVVKRGVPVFDNTMMLDILTDEAGSASGIIAVNLVNGSAHVFRGKKVILCTGGYHWATGKTGGGPESTGDGHYALLKRGIKFKDMELPQYDFCGIHPYGRRPDKERDTVEIAVTFPVNGERHSRIYNKDKKAFTGSFFKDTDAQNIGAFQGTLISTAKEIFAGNGTKGDGSGNGVYFKLDGILEDHGNVSYPSYKGIIRYTNANMPDYKFPDYLEVMANEYSSCGVPQQDPKTCESDIPGLYTIFVSLSAMASTWNWGQSYLAAKDAAAKIHNINELPAFSPDDVEETLNKAYGLLLASAKNPIRSAEVHRNIQRAFYKGQDFLKNGEKMNAMLKELERIRKEDLPRMVCSDKSRVFNRDWKMAMEAEGMLACSLATVHAAIERKESRSPFFRTDYPRMDNENFLCYLWTSMDKNWNFTVEKGDIVDTVLPRETIKQILNDKDPKFDISVPNEY
jgi:succinate dehydrogenase/fumarate reductase flavoprotein subunit